MTAIGIALEIPVVLFYLHALALTFNLSQSNGIRKIFIWKRIVTIAYNEVKEKTDDTFSRLMPCFIIIHFATEDGQ